MGTGSAAVRAHLPALERAGPSAVEVVGVMDIDPARTELVAARLPQATGYGSLESMLDASRPQLVVVATPPAGHLAAIRSAIDRGADVLCEKPLGVTAAEAEELDSLAGSHPGALVATVLQYRCARAWQRIAAEAATACRDGERWRLVVEVERPGTDPLSAGGWRDEAAAQGGILGDHAVHYLGLAWSLDPDMGVTGCTVEDGGETAAVALERASGRASIRVTYRGRRRRNLVALELPGAGMRLAWEGGNLSISGPTGPTAELPTEDISDRNTVNALYGSLYEELLAGIEAREWRARRTAETVAVAGLLAACARMAAGRGVP